MTEIKILNRSVVIKGKTFDECKLEYDRICIGVKENYTTKCSLEKLIFSDMTVTDDECIAVFQIPDMSKNQT
jgi:hypothetical protein